MGDSLTFPPERLHYHLWDPKMELMNAFVGEVDDFINGWVQYGDPKDARVVHRAEVGARNGGGSLHPHTMRTAPPATAAIATPPRFRLGAAPWLQLTRIRLTLRPPLHRHTGGGHHAVERRRCAVPLAPPLLGNFSRHERRLHLVGGGALPPAVCVPGRGGRELQRDEGRGAPYGGGVGRWKRRRLRL